jgi:four helix bundle protein
LKQKNVVIEKSYNFALRIIKLYKYMLKNKNEYVLSKQLLRSGTSIGANVEEAIGGQSTKDFISKMSIAYKEARETHYWIRLLKDSEYINKENAASILNDIDELKKIIASILKTSKKNLYSIKN